MILTHSIRIKRLDLKTAISVASADADFSKLAYFQQEEARIINAGNPFVSNTVCSRPFEQATMLRQGVHLHFILPQAITHFYDDPAKILPAPNRWLIKKLAGKTMLDSWVLESDFLAEQTSINGQVNTILPVDLNGSDYRVFKETTQPFRFVGRLLPAATYFAKGYQPEKAYWEDFMSEGELKRPFTAFAYGNLNFASFYPNCHSVFGFHDLQGLPEHRYEVFGWYAESEKGDAPAYLQALKEFAEAKPKPAESDWENQYGVKAPLSGDLSKAQQLLFYGKSKSADKAFEPGEVKLAMGNDVEEALSAFIAEQQSSDPEAQRKLENQLEAIQFKLLGTQDLDLKPNFEARRHARTFRAHQGNALLGVELYSPKKAEDRQQRQKQLWQLEQEIEQDANGGGASVLRGLREKIQQANELWLVYNQQLEKIESRQQLLHAHWQKYLEAAHPPIGMAYLFPNPDDVLVFLRDGAIAELKQLMLETGLLKVYRQKASESLTSETVVLQIAEDDQWQQKQEIISKPWVFMATSHLPVKTDRNSLAAKLITLLWQIRGIIDALNLHTMLTTHGSEFCLKFELGQRFFEPSMPTLLLASEAFKTNQLARHEREEDEDGETSGEQDQWLSVLGSLEKSPASFKVYLKSLLKSSPGYMSGLPEVVEVRQPAYMDWELYFYPAEKVSYPQRNYRPEFITDSFGLRQESPEFEMEHGVTYTQAVSRYTGRSPLMAGDARILTDKIKELPTEVQQSKMVMGVLKTAERYGYLIQGLTGFNLSFSQQKDSMQLPVGDPIAFEDFKQIYRQLDIAAYIAGQQHATPVADFDFNPVRAGGANLSRLDLIDSFGQRFPLANGDLSVAVPETMTPPVNLAPPQGATLPKIQAFFFPRFMQPVALRAQWLAASNEAYKEPTGKALLHANTNENPVAGWVIYSPLYNGLMFFNTSGEQVASLVVDNGKARKMSPPEAPAEPTDIYLQRFMDFLEKKASFIDVLNIIKEALYLIDPAGSGGHEAMTLLFGRPLALVRMSLNFEVKGDHLSRMDHTSFKSMLGKKNAKPVTSGYEKVEIPIRIGDYRKLNDGVVLCWKDSLQGGKEDVDLNQLKITTSSVPQEEPTTKRVIHSHLSTQSLADGPQRYGMLIDPKAEVHICSGALPMTILHMPERYWKQSQQALRTNLRLGPLMLPQDQIMFDLPRAEGKNWAWLQKKANKELSKTPEQLAIREERYKEGLDTLAETKRLTWNEWVEKRVLISGVFGEEDYAFVNTGKLQELYKAGDGQDTSNLPGSLEAYLNLFEKYGTQIGPFSRDPVWLQNELHEGWAQLYPTPDIKSKT